MLAEEDQVVVRQFGEIKDAEKECLHLVGELVLRYF